MLMKKIFLLAITIIALPLGAKIYAENPDDYYSDMSYEVCLYEEPASEAPPEEVIPEPIKQRRIPNKRLIGTISIANGIVIPGIDVSEIYSFEIYDENDGCLGIFNDSADFVQAIFLYEGNIKIRLLTTEYALVGYL